MKKRIYKFIFFKLMGWKINGTIAPEIKKCIMITVPHTSAHDFYLGIFTRGILDLATKFISKLIIPLVKIPRKKSKLHV